MHTLRRTTRWRGLVLATLVGLGGVAVLARAQEKPAKPDDPVKIPPVTKPAEPAKPAEKPATKPAEKGITLEYHDKPWGSVLSDLRDLSGLPFTGSIRPTGTFTFIPAKGRTYTIPEIVDVLNEGLRPQNLLLIRGEQTYTIIEADKEIDKSIMPRIGLDELGKHGETEIVEVVYPLKSHNADDLRSEVKAMLGAFGECTALTTANQLVMHGKVKVLKRVIKTIQDMEKDDQGGAQRWTYECKFIKARDAERILKQVLGDPTAALQAQQQMQPGFGGFRGDGGFRGFGGGGDFRGFGGGGDFRGLGGGGGDFRGLGGGFGDFRGGDGESRRGDSSRGSTPGARFRPFYIASDDSTNTILINGPADIIAKAKDFVKEIDKGTRDALPVIPGPPILKTYEVELGNAEAVASTLSQKYQGVRDIIIRAAGAKNILVYAPLADQFEIGKQILGGTKPDSTSKTEVIELKTLDPNAVTEILKAVFGDLKNDPKSGAPYLGVDKDRNAVVIKGSASQVQDARNTIRDLGEGTTSTAANNMRIISLDRSNAAALAEALEKMLPQMMKNKVEVVIPGQEKKPEPPKEDRPKPDKQSRLDFTKGVWVAMADNVPMLDQDQPEKKSPPAQDQGQGQPKPAVPGAPLKITAVGNRLIIQSDDPEAIATAQKLIRLLTETPTDQGGFEVIRLKNASATEAAKVLDEVFNGPKQTNQQQQFPFGGGGRGGFFNQFAGAGAQLPANPRENKIRVVADAGSNSLLIKASPIDMLEIRRLLEKAIDSSESDSKAIIKTWTIPLKNTQAYEVANVIKEVYREHINPTSLPGQGGAFRFGAGGFGAGGFGGFGGRQNVNVDANGNPRSVSLSVSALDQTNTLLLACSESMKKDIEQLVKTLEDAAKAEGTKTVSVIPIKGIDPTLVQQAIDAIQGRPISSGVSGFGNTGGGGLGTGMGRFGGNNGGRGGQGGFQGGFGGGGNRGGIPGGGGGGFFPGGGGGGGFQGTFPGGMRPGGGGGGGRPPGGQQSRGPDFFGQRVTDDPEPTFYDPRLDVSASEEESDPPVRGVLGGSVQLTLLEEQQPQPAQPTPFGNVQGPRSPVQAQALSELGVIVIQGNNPADVKLIEELIKQIQLIAAGAELVIEMYYLEQADATSVANTLTQLYQRVNAGASGITTNPNAPRTTTTTGGFFGQQSQTQQGPASVVMIPIPRFNAILLAVAKARLNDVKAEIKRLDVPTMPRAQAVPIPLKHAPASRIAQLVTNFYQGRYPNEATGTQNQIKITFDDTSNTVFVQAAPADLAEIKDLIQRIDGSVSIAVNDLRIFRLNNALADELANLLLQAISAGVVPATAGTTTTAVPTAPAGGGFAALLQQQQLAAQQAQAGAARAAGTTTTKSKTLRFVVPTISGPRVVESGFLEDISITPDTRTNSVIVSAPAQSMELMAALISQLDTIPGGRALIHVFTLKRSDAASIATLLQQLFLGTGGTTQGRTTIPGLPGQGFTPGAGTTGAARPLQLTLGGTTPEGAPLVELRISVDERTNSIIVAGSPNDLDIIEAVIDRLEGSDIQERKNQVYRLKNSTAADIAGALNNLLTSSLQVLQAGPQFTAFQQLQTQVVVVAEPISNSLIISATPRYFDEVIRIVTELDSEPPQVVIQVLVAEVDLSGNEEFGVEIGLQSPVLFQRSVVTGTGSFSNPATPTGVTINSALASAGQPGFLFNNVNLPVGSTDLAARPGIVGYQGLGNLGTGRVSPTAGVGGFVFSAASDSFNLLIRALKQQGRVEILSRPQITTTDNQTARILVGQSFPYVSGTTVTTGIVTNNILYRDVGVQLQVTPKISPDGKVIMRVTPEISSVQATTINLGNGVNASAFNIQTVDTTVIAQDGETVAIGGLIMKKDDKKENKIPWFGDLPGVGAMFRFRTQMKNKLELLVILTPHIVRNRFEADRILAEESRRISWCLGEVTRFHGTSGMDPIYPTFDGGFDSHGPAPVVTPLLPAMPPALNGGGPRETLPPPRPLPQGGSQSQAPPALTTPPLTPVSAAEPGAMPAGVIVSSPQTSPGQQPMSLPSQPATDGTVAPVPQDKETGKWQLFRRKS